LLSLVALRESLNHPLQPDPVPKSHQLGETAFVRAIDTAEATYCRRAGASGSLEKRLDRSAI